MLATGVTLVLSRECAGLELRPVSVFLRKRGGRGLSAVCVCVCVGVSNQQESTPLLSSLCLLNQSEQQRLGHWGTSVPFHTLQGPNGPYCCPPPPRSVATHPAGWFGCGRGTMGASTDMPRHEKHYQTQVFYLLLFWIILLPFLPCFFLFMYIYTVKKKIGGTDKVTTEWS